jgi:hypothetical protein
MTLISRRRWAAMSVATACTAIAMTPMTSAAAGTARHAPAAPPGPMQDCGGDYQCNAGVGYDGPTGNGTPNGLSDF